MNSGSSNGRMRFKTTSNVSHIWMVETVLCSKIICIYAIQLDHFFDSCKIKVLISFKLFFKLHYIFLRGRHLLIFISYFCLPFLSFFCFFYDFPLRAECNLLLILAIYEVPKFLSKNTSFLASQLQLLRQNDFLFLIFKLVKIDVFDTFD
jgi:hypothetical protein